MPSLVNAFVPLEFVPAAALSVLDLALASSLHRAVVRDVGLLQRRRLFESLSLLGLLAALLLAVTNILLWRGNPEFVVLCSAVWVTLCVVPIAVLRRRRRVENDDVPLEIPGMRRDATGTPLALPSSGARPPPSRAPLSPRQLRANLDIYRRSAPRDAPPSTTAAPRGTGGRSPGALRRTPNRRANTVRARRERVEPS